MFQSASESTARRRAKHIGLLARKWRGRKGTCDNYGGFMLIEPIGNRVVAGLRFDLSPADVIDIVNNHES